MNPSSLVATASTAVPFVFLMGALLLVAQLGTAVPSVRRFLFPPSKDGFNAPLEGLRGLCALSVIFTHVGRVWSLEMDRGWEQPDRLGLFYDNLGHVPVTLFFFLSGYLFWQQLLRGSKTGFGSFVRARIRRLVPAYGFALALVTVVALDRAGTGARAIPLSVAGREHTVYVLARWLTFGLPDGIFPGLLEPGDLFRLFACVVWTLRMEWLFYLLVIPLRPLARASRALPLLAGVWVLTTIVDLPSDTYGTRDARTWTDLAVIARDFGRLFVVGFGGGIVTALAHARWRLERLFVHPIATLVGALGIAIGLLLRIDAYTLTASALLLPAFVAVAYGNDAFGLLGSRAAQLLGRVSYPVYLLHGVCFAILWRTHRSWNPGSVRFWQLTLSGGLALLFLATMVHVLVERPFMTRRARADGGGDRG